MAQRDVNSIGYSLNELQYVEKNLRADPDMAMLGDRIAAVRQELQVVQAALALLETSGTGLSQAIHTGTGLALGRAVRELL